MKFVISKDGALEVRLLVLLVERLACIFTACHCTVREPHALNCLPNPTPSRLNRDWAFESPRTEKLPPNSSSILSCATHRVQMYSSVHLYLVHQEGARSLLAGSGVRLLNS